MAGRAPESGAATWHDSHTRSQADVRSCCGRWPKPVQLAALQSLSLATNEHTLPSPAGIRVFDVACMLAWLRPVPAISLRRDQVCLAIGAIDNHERDNNIRAIRAHLHVTILQPDTRE